MKVINCNVCIYILIIGLVGCSTEHTDPSIIALMEVVNQAKTDITISQTLIASDQTPIPTTEQLQSNLQSNLTLLNKRSHEHLPASIRIPDPIIREIASKQILNKDELQTLLNAVSQNQKSTILSGTNVIDFDQPYRVIDSIGYDTIHAYTHPILINDKLIYTNVITSGIKNYASQQPVQSILLNIYKSTSRDSATVPPSWNMVYQKNLR